MFKSENNQITIEQVRKLDEEYTLVDIRDEISFEYGHIDGAKNIPLAKIKEDNSLLPKDKLVVLCCKSGQISDELAEMVALFRVELHSYKGIVSKPNIEAGREETEGYLSANFPVFAAFVNDEYAGYVVCRIDSEVVWVESIFVKEEYRRQGVATALHSKAEEIAASYGNDTVYNYVHPNNYRMIEFLKKRGYTVLNLIEIRKPYKDEKLTQTIVVGEHEFDY